MDSGPAESQSVT